MARISGESKGLLKPNTVFFALQKRSKTGSKLFCEQIAIGNGPGHLDEIPPPLPTQTGTVHLTGVSGFKVNPFHCVNEFVYFNKVGCLQGPKSAQTSNWVSPGRSRLTWTSLALRHLTRTGPTWCSVPPVSRTDPLFQDRNKAVAVQDPRAVDPILNPRARVQPPSGAVAHRIRIHAPERATR